MTAQIITTLLIILIFGGLAWAYFDFFGNHNEDNLLNFKGDNLNDSEKEKYILNQQKLDKLVKYIYLLISNKINELYSSLANIDTTSDKIKHSKDLGILVRDIRKKYDGVNINVIDISKSDKQELKKILSLIKDFETNKEKINRLNSALGDRNEFLNFSLFLLKGNYLFVFSFPRNSNNPPLYKTDLLEELQNYSFLKNDYVIKEAISDLKNMEGESYLPNENNIGDYKNNYFYNTTFIGSYYAKKFFYDKIFNSQYLNILKTIKELIEAKLILIKEEEKKETLKDINNLEGKIYFLETGKEKYTLDKDVTKILEQSKKIDFLQDELLKAVKELNSKQ